MFAGGTFTIVHDFSSLEGVLDRILTRIIAASRDEDASSQIARPASPSAVEQAPAPVSPSVAPQANSTPVKPRRGRKSNAQKAAEAAQAATSVPTVPPSIEPQHHVTAPLHRAPEPAVPATVAQPAIPGFDTAVPAAVEAPLTAEEIAAFRDFTVGTFMTHARGGQEAYTRIRAGMGNPTVQLATRVQLKQWRAAMEAEMQKTV